MGSRTEEFEKSVVGDKEPKHLSEPLTIVVTVACDRRLFTVLA